MMRDVFMEVRQHQQQVQHSLALAGIGFADFFFEIRHDGECVRQQPFEVAGSQRTSLAAAREGVVCADERLIEEMIQTKLLGGECSRDRLLAWGPSATSETRTAHGTPQRPGTNFPGQVSRAYHRILACIEVSELCCVEDAVRPGLPLIDCIAIC